MGNPDLDIVIPAYNEGENILEVLRALGRDVQTSIRVFICYDFDDDRTLSALERAGVDFEIVLVKNRGRGVHDAVMTGFEATTAPAVLTFGADEANNAKIIDAMYTKLREGNDIVVASRLLPGGAMEGGPRFKSLVVTTASYILHRVAFLPATDATYAWRMFSRKILNTVAIESTQGFTYAIELLVKCHRLGWRIAEVPAQWLPRARGQSRFNFRKWLPHYARWFFYALGTTYLRKSPGTVKLKPGAKLN